MQKVVALLLFVLFVLIILFVRKRIKEKGGTVMNVLLELGDIFIWLRFIGGILTVVLLLLFIFAMRSVLMKKDTKDTHETKQPFTVN